MKKKESKSKLPKELTTITRTSRTIALILFFFLPILGFFLGMRYQKTIYELDVLTAPVPGPEVLISPVPTDDPNQVVCTMDAKVCPDGSYVGRTAPLCEFAACPTN